MNKTMRCTKRLFLLLFVSLCILPSHSTRADEPKQKTSTVTEKGREKGKARSRDDAKATVLAYESPEDFFAYRVEVKNQFTEQSTRTVVGELIYRRTNPPIAYSDFFEANARAFHFSGTMKEVQPQLGRSTRPFFQLGDFNVPGMAGLNGNINLLPTNPVIVSDPRFGTVDGLPWSYGELAFPALPEDAEDEWTHKRELVVVQSNTNHFRLHDADRENLNSGVHNVFGVGRAVTPSVTLALEYKRRSTKGRETIVNETIRLDGEHLSPKIVITGKGTLHFDHDLGAFSSMERDLDIEIRDDANTTKYPVSIRVERLSGKELSKFEAEEKKRLEVAKKLMEERVAKQKAMPSLDDREAFLKLLENGNDTDLSMALQGVTRHPDLKEDKELGLALYKAIFRSRSAGYSAVEILKTVSPKLHQSASIAKDYWSSFDIGLTGDLLTDETKLVRGQYVCYPMYSRWQAGEFYGAVEDVIVIKSNDHDRPLKVFRRAECRMPSPQFIDPVLMDKSKEPQEEEAETETE
jgi:hypothetical protein